MSLSYFSRVTPSVQPCCATCCIAAALSAPVAKPSPAGTNASSTDFYAWCVRRATTLLAAIAS